ncbi:MAG: hypothetical protein ACYDBV_15220 [Nitrospiria bacterium]
MNETLEKNLYKALKTKDARYDGRVYFGVKTTRDYLAILLWKNYAKVLPSKGKK